MPLHPYLDAGIRCLRRTIRVGRAVHALGLMLLVLACLFLAAWLWDASLGIGLWQLRGLLVVGGLLTFALIVRGTMLFMQRLPTAKLAAAIEHKYPTLGERLWTLAQAAEMPPSWREHLSAETVSAAQGLDFRAAYSWERSKQTARFAAGALVLVVGALVFSASARQLCARAGHAFSADALGYTLTVTPGDAAAAKGSTLLISAHAVVTHEFARLPKDVYLVADGQRQKMEPQEAGAFFAALPGNADRTTYHIETDGYRSQTYEIEFLPRVKLAGPVRYTLIVPEYASGSRHLDPDYSLGINRDVRLYANLPASPGKRLQYSELGYYFELDRPARSGFLRLQNSQHERDVPLKLSGKRVNCTFEVNDLGNFTPELHVTCEHGISTIIPLPMFSVFSDQPPQFVEELLPPKTGERIVETDEVLRLKIAVEDFVGLGQLDVEWRVGDGPTTRSKMLEFSNAPKFVGDVLLPLRGKVTPGDQLHVRAAVSDNRRLDIPEKLKPQWTYSPQNKDAWLTFAVRAPGDSPQKQLVLAQHDDFARRILAAKFGVEREKQLFKAVHKASHQLPGLTGDQKQQAEQGRKLNQTQQQALRALGQELVVDPSLRPLGQAAFSVADNDLGPVDESAEKIIMGNLAMAARENEFYKNDLQLLKALQNLDAMLKINSELATKRMQQADLERILAKEDSLVQKAKELAALDPKEIAKELAALKEQQEKLLDELRKWAEANPELQKQLAEAKAVQLAEQAKELAGKQRKLSIEDPAKLQEKMKKEFAEIAGKQEKLAAKTKDFQTHLLEKAVELAKQVPAKPASSAAKLLREGLVENAIGEQGKTFDDLTELSPKVGKKEEPKARALAEEQRLLQEETYLKLAELMKHHGNGGGEERAGLEKKVEDLSKDLMKLAQTGSSPEGKEAAAEAAMAADQAKDLMKKSDNEKAKGNLGKSDKMEAEAALKLELAAQKADASAKAMSQKKDGMPDPLAQSFEETEAKMTKAAQRLAKSAAPEDLKLAAESLKKTSQMAGDLFSQQKPTPNGMKADPSSLPVRDLSLTPEEIRNLKGKGWGELPGELRAKIVEDFRGQFGDEYGPIIQRYFQRLAEETPRQRE